MPTRKRESFLDILARHPEAGSDVGDTHGGGGGSPGRGLPSGGPSNFMFATGIECSYPTIQHGKVRRDQLRECGHYDRWREDFGLVKELGLKVLRYGLPYYAIHQGPGKFDWEFADQAMAELKRLEITPILDLMHFGVPDWVGNYQNPDLPRHFAEYADAVAARYPWVRYYTPVNEIYVTAKFSGKTGAWNEQLKSDRAFVTAIKHAVAASIVATQRIAARRPDCVIVQSESAEYTHDVRAEPTPESRLQNQERFIALDLLYAHVPDAMTYQYLLDHGLTRAEYDWFMKGEPPGYQVMGNDYYGNNETIVTPKGQRLMSEDVNGWYLITKEYYERYKRPVMHTETNLFDAERAPAWLWKQWVNVVRMRADGVPVLGFTWYSLTDQVDWDTGLTEQHGRVNPCGLYDLDRRPRPVAAAYRELLEEFGQITLVPHAEMLAVTDQPAMLKVKI